MSTTLTKIRISNYRCRKGSEDGTWCVVDCLDTVNESNFTATGTIPEPPPTPFDCTLVGKWNFHERYGKQFRFYNIFIDRPVGREGTLRLIQSVRSIGPKMAATLWREFGDNLFDTVLNHPEEVRERTRIRRSVLSNLQGYLRALDHNASRLAAIYTLLDGIRVPRNLPKILAVEYSDPVTVLTINPYLLMNRRGIGFRTCDELRKKLKRPANMPERYMAAVVDYVRESKSQMWLPVDGVGGHFLTLDIFEELDYAKLVQDCLEAGLLIELNGLLTQPNRAQTELDLCRNVMRFAGQPETHWPDMSRNPILTDHQKEALHRAFKNGRIAFLVGYAGSGKSTAGAEVIKQLSNWKVGICAPTGKAAQRLGEALMSRGVYTRPTTIHKMLDAKPHQDGFVFMYNRNQQLPYDLVVVDEASMIPNTLFNQLLDAIQPHTHILVIGDPAQLPPVGHGAMLRDWVDFANQDDNHYTAGVLSEIHRNGGNIVSYASTVRKGAPVMPEGAGRTKGVGYNRIDNLHFIGSDTPARTERELLRFIDSMEAGHITRLNRTPVDLLRDFQVVVAVNRHGNLSRERLNKLLQGRINGANQSLKRFWLNDRVICLRNTPVDDRTFIANGEIGSIVSIQPRHYIFRSHTQNETTYRFEAFDPDFDLAYAVTCHKMQGDQSPIVFVILDANPCTKMICGNEWYYTAITRAQELCVVCGLGRTVEQFVSTFHCADRNTNGLYHLQRIADNGDSSL